jgi:hypothetical protein
VSSRAVEPPPEPEPDRSAIAGSGGWIGDGGAAAAGGPSAGVGLGSRLSWPRGCRVQPTRRCRPATWSGSTASSRSRVTCTLFCSNDPVNQKKRSHDTILFSHVDFKPFFMLPRGVCPLLIFVPSTIS